MVKKRFFHVIAGLLNCKKCILQVKTPAMARILLLILFFCLNSSLLLAQNTSKEGKLLQKAWTKTIESYCAQGSEYWVLQEKMGEEWVLEGTEKQKKVWKEYENRQVWIKGKIKTKTIEPTKTNPMEQRPIRQNPITGKDEPYTCIVLKVNQLNPLDKNK